MRGVLGPGGTRLAPTEAARRSVACCFERPEQLPEKKKRSKYRDENSSLRKRWMWKKYSNQSFG